MSQVRRSHLWVAHRQTGNSSFQLVITLALSWEGGPVPTALREVQDTVHRACRQAQGCVLATLIGQNVLLTVVSSVVLCSSQAGALQEEPQLLTDSHPTMPGTVLFSRRHNSRLAFLCVTHTQHWL